MELNQSVLFYLLIISLFVLSSRGFYIPGVAPTEYEKGTKLDIRVILMDTVVGSF